VAPADFPYQKLPGVRHGIFTGSSLWLADDHILHVKNTRFAEDYRRYYLNDIEAIYLEKKARFTPPPVGIIGIVVALIAQIVFSFTHPPFAMDIVWSIIAALGIYIAWLCLFQSCVCYVQTALGTDRLSCLHRVKGARQAIERITTRVIETQGPLEDYLESPAVDAAPAEDIPQPAQPGTHERLFGWLALPFVWISSTIVIKLPVPIPTLPFAVALGTILVGVILAVLALIAGRKGGRFRAVQGTLVALVQLAGLEMYALLLTNTYSQTPSYAGEASATAGMFSMMAAATHKGSIWLAAANIAVAFLGAVLLFRNAPPARDTGNSSE
jgi:hypothetical protein